jgi:hypothetical protein
MNSFILFWSNDRRQFITDDGSFALADASHFPLQLPFGAIAVSQKWIYIWAISIMVQLHIVEASPAETYKVV